MEVLVESPNRSPSTMDHFDLSSVMISPYLSAPSSPKRFGEYYSEFYQEFDYFSSSSSIPFEAPSNKNVDDDDDDKNDGGDGFAFYVNRESDTSSRSAEELFDGGKIKPLKPESEGKKNVLQALSPKKKNKSRYGDNPFASENEQRGREERGRDRTPASVLLSSSKSGRRVTRSHSPYRTPQHTWEEEEQQQQQQPRSNKEESTTSSSNSRVSSSSKGSSRRWRLRDILLFRSVSEGRGSSKDYKKYSGGYKKGEEVNGTRRKGPVSAHEFHYAMKKAESEDLKKRTFLPYRQGILGKLAGFGF